MSNRKKKRKGPIPKHGGFSIVNKAALIKDRKRLSRYLRDFRDELILNLGGEAREEGLTALQKALIERLVSLLGTLRLIEIYVSETGVLKDGQLIPILKEGYLRYLNSFKLIADKLGINVRRESDFDVVRYMEEKYGSDKPEGEKADSRAQDRSGEAIEGGDGESVEENEKSSEKAIDEDG